VVVWEEDHQGNGGRSDLGREFVVLAGGSDLLESGYLNTRAELERGVRPAITSPFVEGQNVLGVKRYRQGNPLPYAPQGVDSPRTFAYKMLAQEGARRWYAGKEKEEEDRFPVRTAEGVVSTTAKDRWGQERYRGGYVTEQEVLQAANPEKVVRLDGEQKYVDRTGLKPPTMRLGETEVEITLKPYLPGWTAPSRTGYLTGDSPYQREKVAGVDAVGLLMGSIAMTGEGENGIAGKVRSALNVFVGQKLNEYYGMQGGASGIGVDGRPVFGSSTTESPLSGYRFTRGDIERATVLVPDVSLVQAGDLVVRYGVEGEAQVGIVVKVLDGARPVYGEAPGEFLQRIVVATVRRGFREVTVGTWGNSGGTFGGFTAEPERYQLRRLLKYVENNGEKAAKPEENGSWELVKEVPVRVRDYYPPDVPTRRFLRYAAALLPAADTVWNLVTKGWLFERNLPPTSYDNKVGSMIGTAENPPRPLPMVLTESTGWRYREIPGRVLTTYHPAIDIALAGDALGKYIIAPESGEFSVMAVDPLERIRLPDGDVLDLGVGFDSPSNIKPEERLTGPGSYAFTAYGVVGVLVTNPTRPKDGRIYLYAHQGHNQANEGEVGRTLEGVYRAVYTGDPRGQLALPRMEDDDVATWVKVSAGEWIGQVGDQGVGSKAHIHLEVLEYFERTSDGEPLGAWRRINPQSLFRDGIWSTDWKSSIYDSSPDHVEQLLKLEFMSNRHGSEANKPEPDALKAAEGHFRPSPY
jgi:murein DD-endopeptidase MepM/ murein hydrolase activator NlpD